jgi:hypothetical protein
MHLVLNYLTKLRELKDYIFVLVRLIDILRGYLVAPRIPNKVQEILYEFGIDAECGRIDFSDEVNV